MGLIRLLFRVTIILCLILFGTCAYLYLTYRPLIDLTLTTHYENQIKEKDQQLHFEKLPTSKNKKAEFDKNLDLSGILPAEAQPFESQIQREVSKFKGVPLKGLLGMAQSKINQARSKLNEASAKLARAKPEDPQKRSKVQKAKQLLPKAYRLLNRAESLLHALNSMQESTIEWFEGFRS